MVCEVIQFPGHHWHSCEKMECGICEGNLSVCTTCGGGEGSLTTDCPGRRVTQVEDDAVYGGKLDFIKGQWIDQPAAFCGDQQS